MKRCHESGLSRDEQERFGCDLKCRTDDFLGTKNDNTHDTHHLALDGPAAYTLGGILVDCWDFAALRSSIRHSRASMPSYSSVAITVLVFVIFGRIFRRLLAGFQKNRKLRY